MALYNDYDALFERFSIMTESPTANYTAALEYCCNNTTPELAERLRNETMQAAQLPETQTADFETLSKYIDCGFELYPCVYSNKYNKYLPITLNGKIALYDTDEQKQAKDRHGITDKTILHALCNQTKTTRQQSNY